MKTQEQNKLSIDAWASRHINISVTLIHIRTPSQKEGTRNNNDEMQIRKEAMQELIGCVALWMEE